MYYLTSDNFVTDIRDYILSLFSQNKFIFKLVLVTQTVFDMIMIWIPSHTLTSTFGSITRCAIAVFPAFKNINRIAKWTGIVWICDCTKIMPSETQSAPHCIILFMRIITIPMLTCSSRNSFISIGAYKCLRGIQAWERQPSKASLSWFALLGFRFLANIHIHVQEQQKEFHSLLVSDVLLLTKKAWDSLIVDSKFQLFKIFLSVKVIDKKVCFANKDFANNYQAFPRNQLSNKI